MSLLYTSTVPSPSGDNSEEARSTVQPVRETVIAEVDVSDEAVIVPDAVDELTGLASRQAGAEHHAREQVTFDGLTSDDYGFVDRRYAAMGRAPALEMNNQFGRGTMQYDVSISPQIQGHEVLGGDMFSAERQMVQGQAGSFMTGVVPDNTYQALTAAAAQRQARKAYSDSLFKGWTE